jgi:DmsE family decaheme c-type cytochrome
MQPKEAPIMTRALLALAVPLTLFLSASPPGLAQETGPPGGLCADCHEDVVKGAAAETHMRIQSFEVGGKVVGCEGCHGDGAKHVDAGGDKELIRRFGDESSDDACLSCHAAKGMSGWHASTHKAEGVSCVDCHRIHAPSNPLAGCKTCHADVTSRFQLPSHHPVREGKMTCSSCHDPHSAAEAQLDTAQRVNELCYRCHLDKEGPYIFEHQPVQEDCRLCHNPHGTTARRLLTANEPMLCLQCHEIHFHAGYRAEEATEYVIGGITRQNPNGPSAVNRAYNTRCSACHSRVHGSDLPTQAVSGRGQGLVR